MTARAEQETTITVGRDEPVVYVYTSDPRHLRRLRALVASVDFVDETSGGDEWANFTVAAENFNALLAIRKPRVRSDAQRAAAAASGARLAAARAAVTP